MLQKTAPYTIRPDGQDTCPKANRHVRVGIQAWGAQDHVPVRLFFFVAVLRGRPGSALLAYLRVLRGETMSLHLSSSSTFQFHERAPVMGPTSAKQQECVFLAPRQAHMKTQPVGGQKKRNVFPPGYPSPCDRLPGCGPPARLLPARLRPGSCPPGRYQPEIV